MKPPTKRQLECLLAIDAYIREHNHSPSIRNICDTLKCSVNNAIGFINMLERLKLINRPVGSARSITLTQSGLALLYPELRFSAEARIEELGL